MFIDLYYQVLRRLSLILAEDHRFVVGRHVDDFDQAEPVAGRQRGDVVEVADAPGRVAPAQIGVEGGVAGRGMDAGDPVRAHRDLTLLM